jgi:hypothetical protein
MVFGRATRSPSQNTFNNGVRQSDSISFWIWRKHVGKIKDWISGRKKWCRNIFMSHSMHWFQAMHIAAHMLIPFTRALMYETRSSSLFFSRWFFLSPCVCIHGHICSHTNQKLKAPVGNREQTGLSDFVDSDDSQERRRHLMIELLLWPSNVRTKNRKKPWQPNELRRGILDLIDEKKKN